MTTPGYLYASVAWLLKALRSIFLLKAHQCELCSRRGFSWQFWSAVCSSNCVLHSTFAVLWGSVRSVVSAGPAVGCPSGGPTLGVRLLHLSEDTLGF